MNYNDKDKTFVYQEEGTAIFKLFAIHTGHEPGPLDGNARIIHRVVGNKGAFDFDPEIYGVREDMEPESFVGLMGKDDTGDLHRIVLQQVQDLKVETVLLEGRIAKTSPEMLGSLSQELSNILHRFKRLQGGVQQSDETFVDTEMIEEEDPDFGSDLVAIVPWDRMAADCQDRKMLMRDSLKSDKWMLKEDCSDFDEKIILNCGEDEDSKLIKPLSDPTLVTMQVVDGFYADSTKWLLFSLTSMVLLYTLSFTIQKAVGSINFGVKDFAIISGTLLLNVQKLVRNCNHFFFMGYLCEASDYYFVSLVLGNFSLADKNHLMLGRTTIREAFLDISG
ncbi:hypothetical protein MUK42_07508 [Musa troglodytarum]|uniref:Uncharacterized protein n=1 Tax=Musa troglodytarum TaxID=320322 RepID=A0A9E7JJ39_9LILI|nr:hypothetical protein MUK42_07508 [Musa troglodytarum]